MRVTNTMMTNSALINMNKNKEAYNNYLEQYTTQKKIQRPSDDPVIAVRSLKFRTSYIEITQYVEKNIPDAESWMTATEKPLKEINSIYTNLADICDQGANDTNTVEERQNLAATMQQYKEYIYQEQGNADYAGRYLFTGFRTDVPLVFAEDTSDYTYTIDQDFTFSDVDNFNYVKSNLSYTAGNTAAQYAQTAATYNNGHRTTLAYADVDGLNSITYSDAGGGGTLSVANIDISNENAYDIDKYNTVNGTSYDAICIKETGEVIYSSSAYTKLSNSTGIKAQYTKKNFASGEIRPEHYYNCTQVNNTSGEVKNYADAASQKIEYEVNFSQSLQVNVLGCNAIDTSVGRAIDDVMNILNNIDTTQSTLDSINKMLEDESYSPASTKEAVTELKTQVENQLTLQNKQLQEAFSSTITVVQKAQAKLNVATADLGAREKRLALTKNKLEDQQTDFEEALSDNEDANLGTAYIKYNEADLLYQATLSATAKVLGNTLLDFI